MLAVVGHTACESEMSLDELRRGAFATRGCGRIEEVAASIPLATYRVRG